MQEINCSIKMFNVKVNYKMRKQNEVHLKSTTAEVKKTDMKNNIDLNNCVCVMVQCNKLNVV